MKKGTQIVVIHGGMTFKKNKDYLHFLKTRPVSVKPKIRWSDQYLTKQLGKKFEFIRPRMPAQDNAKYAEWKIHFERHFPYFRNGIILLGSSLGAIFLAKYLSENKFPKRILATYLVCPPFDNTLPTHELAGGFKLKADLSRLEKSSKNLTLLFSENDTIVPISHAEKYRNKLRNAKIILFPNIKGHFQIATFPEIIKMIKNVTS
jgi:predicted alpha/beta hydrolase family esterase